MGKHSKPGDDLSMSGPHREAKPNRGASEESSKGARRQSGLVKKTDRETGRSVRPARRGR